MVDVSAKTATKRTAVAAGVVRSRADVIALIASGGLPKGDALATARIAGIMAAKKTSDLIPLCHPLALSKVEVELVAEPELSAVRIETYCRLKGQTGVEMEALTAASVAALTLYDMCKAVDKGMVVESLCLLEKRGGKSGDFQREEAP